MGLDNEVQAADMPPEDWTFVSAEWVARLDRAREAVETWRELIKSPKTPAVGSVLAEDDVVFPALPCSQLAWWGLSVGVEHLDAAIRLVDQQVGEGGPLLPAANFTVLRGALLGASQAIVLLLPASSHERTTFGLQIAHDEYEQVIRFREYTLSHEGLVPEARRNAAGRDYVSGLKDARQQLRTLLAGRGLNRDRRKLRDTAMIKEAGRLAYQADADGPMLQLGVDMEWRMASGAAHGRLLMALHRTGGHVSEENGRTAFLGGTYQEIVQQITNVCLMLNTAWGGWEQNTIGPTEP